MARRRAQPSEVKWEQFSRLAETQDTPVLERRGLRLRLMLPYVAFVIPVEDPAVIAQLVEWQDAFRPLMAYAPQPSEHMHITVHNVGMLRPAPWMLLPNTWRRPAVTQLGRTVGAMLGRCPQFDVRIGPLNAFPNILFAEVQDDHQCLRRLRTRIRRALPLRARPAAPWSYLPHVTLGYWGRQPAAPIIEALRPYREVPPLPLRVTKVLLTLYTRAPLANRDVLINARVETIAAFELRPREPGE